MCTFVVPNHVKFPCVHLHSDNIYNCFTWIRQVLGLIIYTRLLLHVYVSPPLCRGHLLEGEMDFFHYSLIVILEGRGDFTTLRSVLKQLFYLVCCTLLSKGVWLLLVHLEYLDRPLWCRIRCGTKCLLHHFDPETEMFI